MVAFGSSGGSRPALPTSHEARGLRGTAFGPVPSRRFGCSLGINNIPPKVCTYSCVYCQVGRALQVHSDRRAFFGASAVTTAVRGRVEAAVRAAQPIDCLTFVPDGEPTLDVGLERSIHVLRDLGIPIAVLTNGSLLNRSDVRAALAEADHVSLKVDTVREATWRRINRPHRRLRLAAILEGMATFAQSFEGSLSTETMLVSGLNDGESELRATAAFVGDLNPETAYVTVPTRPPAESWAVPPDEAALARAHEVFRRFHPRVELLLGYEGDGYVPTGDPVEDLLCITGVHPMREAAVRRLLARGGAGWGVVEQLVASGTLVQVRYGPHRYLVRARAGGGGCAMQGPSATPSSREHGSRSSAKALGGTWGPEAASR
jgi:wyosine [tRNA(Phe)-imidazoG37] synthetase (radical SAM superfamily)